MILALDTNCILPGRVGGIESYVLSIIESLLAHATWLQRLVLITRTEDHALFEGFQSDRCTAQLLRRPTHNGQEVSNWSALSQRDPDSASRLLADYQQAKATCLKSHRADVVHFPSGTINPLDLPLPTVLTIHDLQHRHFPQYFSQAELDDRNRWWTASARATGAVLTDSAFVANDVHRQFDIPGDKIFTAYPVIQSAFFSAPSQASLQNLRQRCSLLGPFFLYPAALWPHKNHHRLIRAFAAADISAQLVLTGAGQETSDLPALIASLNAQDKIRLLGRVSTEQLVGLYHLATALIFPSQCEGCGLPAMEAMACSCPVAAANVTSLPEILGAAAIYFSPTDDLQIRDAIRRVADDADLRRDLIRRGRQRLQDFTPTRFVQSLHAAYAHAIESSRHRQAA